MRRFGWIAAGAVALATVSFTGVAAFARPSMHRPSSASPYMRVCGLQFCIGASGFYPYGATFYESTGQAGITNPSGAISLAQSQHLNTIRLVNFLSHDGNPSSDAFDAAIWKQADTFVADAQAAGIRILLDLSDYKAQLWNNCINPYTASWSKYLSFVAHRINSVTGKQYRADPEIVMVTFTGEPLPVGSHSFTDAAGAPCTISYTTAQLTHFYAVVERKWRSMDRNHLTSAGGLSNVDLPNNGIDWKAIFGNRHNSVCGWKTYGGMINWVSTGAQYCQNVLHKPWFNDEWGYTQAMGDSSRAASFTSQFRNNQKYGAAGNFYWNANYLVTSSTYDVGPGTPLTQAVVVNNAP
jgi:hypothetical protein